MPTNTHTIITVERAIGDLKRGIPVQIIQADGASLLTLAAETLNAQSFAVAGIAAKTSGNLVLTAKRLQALCPSYTKPEAGNIAVTAKALKDIAKLSGNTGEIPSLKPKEIHTPNTLDLAALQLTRLAQLLPAAVTVASQPSGELPLVSVSAENIAHYKETIALTLVEMCRAPLILKQAKQAEIIAFRSPLGGQEHYALIIGKPGKHPLIRVHSSCYTGDLLNSLSCDCHDQLHVALDRMAKGDGGIILYMMQEGRDIGLINKLRAYALKHKGYDTVDANEILGFDDDERLFLPAVQMLKLLGISKVRLMTNNPRKASGLTEHGIAVTECVSHIIASQEHNAQYLKTKAERLGHKLEKK